MVNVRRWLPAVAMSHDIDFDDLYPDRLFLNYIGSLLRAASWPLAGGQMDVERFLVRQGWKKGEGLRPGSIKKPLLVKHRKNNKGLGFNPQASEGWWERVFDGHLKSLGVSSGENVTFEIDEEKRRRDTSPLYASFLSGGILEGSIKRHSTIEDAKPKKERKHRSRDHKAKESRSTSKGSKRAKDDSSADNAIEKPKKRKRTKESDN